MNEMSNKCMSKECKKYTHVTEMNKNNQNSKNARNIISIFRAELQNICL